MTSRLKIYKGPKSMTLTVSCKMCLKPREFFCIRNRKGSSMVKIFRNTNFELQVRRKNEKPKF